MNKYAAIAAAKRAARKDPTNEYYAIFDPCMIELKGRKKAYTYCNGFDLDTFYAGTPAAHIIYCTEE